MTVTFTASSSAMHKYFRIAKRYNLQFHQCFSRITFSQSEPFRRAQHFFQQLYSLEIQLSSSIVPPVYCVHCGASIRISSNTYCSANTGAVLSVSLNFSVSVGESFDSFVKSAMPSKDIGFSLKRINRNDCN